MGYAEQVNQAGGGISLRNKVYTKQVQTRAVNIINTLSIIGLTVGLLIYIPTRVLFSFCSHDFVPLHLFQQQKKDNPSYILMIKLS